MGDIDLFGASTNVRFGPVTFTDELNAHVRLTLCFRDQTTNLPEVYFGFEMLFQPNAQARKEALVSPFVASDRGQAM